MPEQIDFPLSYQMMRSLSAEHHVLVRTQSDLKLITLKLNDLLIRVPIVSYEVQESTVGNQPSSLVLMNK